MPPGTAGLLRIRVEDDVQGYLDDPEASRAYFRDGYFHPGDIAVLRADGRLALQGRVTDVINALGTKMASGPIEQDLQNRLGVCGVGGFSMQSQDGGEDLHVVVEGPALTRAQVEGVVKGRFLSVFPSVRFHFMMPLPRNAMGKVVRREVIGRLEASGRLSAKSPPA